MAVDDPEASVDTPPRVVAHLGAPSLRGVARLVAIVAACAGALYVLYLTRGVVRILVIALFTATALGPVVDAVQRARVPRAAAILIVYLACLVAVIWLAYVFGALLAIPAAAAIQLIVRDLRTSPTDPRAQP